MDLWRGAERRLSRRSAKVLCALMAPFLAALAVTAAAQNLSVQLASAPPAPGLVSTGSSDTLSLVLQSGQTVNFAREAGRELRLQGRRLLPWSLVQEVARDQDSVTVTPTLQDDGNVLVELDVAYKRGDARQRYRSTVLAPPGEWVRLLGSGPESTARVKRLGTQDAGRDSLYLRVEQH